MTHRALGIGHCGYDAGRLSRVLAEAGATFVNVHSPEAALRLLAETPHALVLPNRVIGGDGGGGLAFIRALKADAALGATPVMLVTDHADRQQEAEAAGALPGFGKGQLESASVKALLREHFEER